MAAYKNKVRVAAHRGNSCVCPENTLVAMRSALEDVYKRQALGGVLHENNKRRNGSVA